MSDFIDKYKQHPIHTTVENMERTFESVPEIESAEHLARVERHRDVLRLVASLLDKLDPALVSDTSLAQANKVLSQLNSEIAAFFSNRNVGHLNNADARLDGLFSQLAALWVATPSSFKDFPAELADYKKAVYEFRDQMAESIDQFRQRVEGTQSELESEFSSLKNEVAKQKQMIERQAARIDTVVESLQAQFSADQQKRNQEYAETHKERNSQFHDALSEIRDSWSETESEIEAERKKQIGDFEKQVDDAIEFMEAKKRDASNLLQITTNITVTGNYNKMATSDRWWSHGWRFAALILMIASVYLASKAVNVALASEEGYSLQAVLLRVGIALVVGGPAVYAAREAEKHRRSARQYRKMELELASIDPYLESLKPEDRDQLKAKLADRLFAQSDLLASNKDESVSFLEDLVKTGWNALLRK